MKITLLSYEDSGGGAGRAALKLQHALEDFGVDIETNCDPIIEAMMLDPAKSNG